MSMFVLVEEEGEWSGYRMQVLAAFSDQKVADAMALVLNDTFQEPEMPEGVAWASGAGCAFLRKEWDNPGRVAVRERHAALLTKGWWLREGSFSVVEVPVDHEWVRLTEAEEEA